MRVSPVVAQKRDGDEGVEGVRGYRRGAVRTPDCHLGPLDPDCSCSCSPLRSEEATLYPAIWGRTYIRRASDVFNMAIEN